MKIIVIGAGIMGLSSAWALARDGHQVTVYEQGDVPNPLGSSIDEHRLIRHPYGGERGYTRMIDPAYAAWDRLWSDLGARHYLPTGTLVLDHGDTWATDTTDTLTAEGVPFRQLGARGVAETYPMLAAAGLRGGLLLESGGTLLAGRIVAHLARYLPTRGVAVETRIRISRVDPERGRVWLADDLRGDHLDEADLIVVAAGPWAPRLLASLRPRVAPSRQAVAYLNPPTDLVAAWQAHPMVLDLDLTSGFYLVPPRKLPAGGTTGLKIGDHRFTMTGDPDSGRAATGEETHRLLDLCGRSLRGFERYMIREIKTCFYDVETVEHFIVEPAGARGWVLSGFSGHGFKFGALIGLELARTLRGERTAEDLTAWAAGA